MNKKKVTNSLVISLTSSVSDITTESRGYISYLSCPKIHHYYLLLLFISLLYYCNIFTNIKHILLTKTIAVRTLFIDDCIEQ